MQFGSWIRRGDIRSHVTFQHGQFWTSLDMADISNWSSASAGVCQASVFRGLVLRAARTLVTRIGKLELRVPQDRGGRFSTELFERYQTLGAGAGCGAGGDVRAGGFDSQSQDDHRGVVRPQLFGLVDQRDQPAAGCEPGAICRPWLGRSVPLSDPRRALRAGARGRGDLEPVV